MKKMLRKKVLLCKIFFLLMAINAFADSWTPDKPSHATLYVDTLTSKTDGSSVNIADTQGLFVTGDVKTLGNILIQTSTNEYNYPLKVSMIPGEGVAFYGSQRNIHFGWGATEDVYLRSGYTSGNVILQDEGGNVGIGTTGPTKALTVVRGGGNTALLTSSGTNSGSYYIEPNSPVLTVTTDGSDSVGSSAYLTNPIFVVGRGGATTGPTEELLRVNLNGNVGIGTTGPDRLLHLVTGNVGLHLQSNTAAPTHLWFENTAQDWALGIDPFNSNAFTIGVDPNGDPRSNQLVTITTLGNVGIGTTSPGAKLDVNGIVIAENIRKTIWSTGTSGTYNLKTIFDSARSAGLSHGVYDCVLRTSNGAHWTGRRFTASVNFYINHPSFPHKFHNVFDIQAEPNGGCSGGLTSFDGATGNFAFDTGNCFQNIALVCNWLY